MKKILYFSDKSSDIKFLLPFVSKISTKKEDLEKFSVIIFDESFLSKKYLKPSILENKICIVNLKKEDKKNIGLIKKYNFFDYITKKDSREIILFKLDRAFKFLKSKQILLNKEKKIQKVLMVDSLTGVYNWRYFIARTDEELSRAKRNSLNISFIGIDIDNFRRVNELYGIKVADSIIKGLVDILKKNLRREDIITRWREDEFFIIISSFKEKKDLQKIVERLKEKITSNVFFYKNIRLKINVSIGIVIYPEDNIFSSKDVINALEDCFINIKRKGGNSILFYSDRTSFEEKSFSLSLDIKELKEKLKKLDSLLSRDVLEMIYGFAKMIEAKDLYTGKHIEDTALFAEKIAKQLNLPPSDIESVKRAAILHDLGKIAIDEKILSKKGPLNNREKEIIKSHPVIGAEILKEIKTLRGVVPAILYHHERYDGKGYPIGLKGDEIPLSARIVGLADVYHALISDRPYRKALNKEKAIEIIKKEVGKQFDPKVVEAFLKVVKK